MQKKKVRKEEKFELLTVEEMESVQGGGEENLFDKVRGIVIDILNGISNYINLQHCELKMVVRIGWERGDVISLFLTAGF